MNERLRAVRAAAAELPERLRACLLDCRGAGPAQEEAEADLVALIREATELRRGIELVTTRLQQHAVRLLNEQYRERKVR